MTKSHQIQHPQHIFIALSRSRNHVRPCHWYRSSPVTMYAEVSRDNDTRLQEIVRVVETQSTKSCLSSAPTDAYTIQITDQQYSCQCLHSQAIMKTYPQTKHLSRRDTNFTACTSPGSYHNMSHNLLPTGEPERHRGDPNQSAEMKIQIDR